MQYALPYNLPALFFSTCTWHNPEYYRVFCTKIFCFLSPENTANWGRHLYASDSRVKHLIDSEQFKEEDKKGIDVPFFNLEDILAATDDFSDANKLGQGGFGPVYKVIVLNFHVPLIFQYWFLIIYT